MTQPVLHHESHGEQVHVHRDRQPGVGRADPALHRAALDERGAGAAELPGHGKTVVPAFPQRLDAAVGQATVAVVLLRQAGQLLDDLLGNEMVGVRPDRFHTTLVLVCFVHVELFSSRGNKLSRHPNGGVLGRWS
nr:hypothetical protein GCM10020241_63970 [Streptoalloteichus tenebrarius]